MLSQPRHCGKSAQPTPKAVYHSRLAIILNQLSVVALDLEPHISPYFQVYYFENCSMISMRFSSTGKEFLFHSYT